MRTCLLKIFIYEMVDNFCIVKQNKNVEYKKNSFQTFFVSFMLLALNGSAFLEKSLERSASNKINFYTMKRSSFCLIKNKVGTRLLM
jgi:hypothetical protein